MKMQWKKEEEEYLRILEETSICLSKDYHNVYFTLQATQSRLRIPAIVIGSFTGVASFGTSTFPKKYHPIIAIIVGIVNVCIAILNTVESYFKLGENINLAASASLQLRKLANDINRELSVDESVRETSGINYLRDCYTRYQQILSGAPILRKFKAYRVHVPNSPSKKGFFRNLTLKGYFTPTTSSSNTPARTSVEENKLHKQIREIQFYTRKVDAATSTDLKLPTILPTRPTTNTHTIEIEEYEDI